MKTEMSRQRGRVLGESQPEDSAVDRRSCYTCRTRVDDVPSFHCSNAGAVTHDFRAAIRRSRGTLAAPRLRIIRARNPRREDGRIARVAPAEFKSRR